MKAGCGEYSLLSPRHPCTTATQYYRPGSDGGEVLFGASVVGGESGDIESAGSPMKEACRGVGCGWVQETSGFDDSPRRAPCISALQRQGKGLP